MPQPHDPGRPHSRSLRCGRHSESGRIYLLTTVTARRRPLFADWRLGRLVVRTMAYYEAQGAITSWAFVVMPDHLHWLLALEPGTELAGFMRSFKAHAARRINRARGTPGRTVWQAGFHDHAVRREEDIRSLARYVVANPLRAGLVREIAAYPLWDAAWL